MYFLRTVSRRSFYEARAKIDAANRLVSSAFMPLRRLGAKKKCMEDFNRGCFSGPSSGSHLMESSAYSLRNRVRLEKRKRAIPRRPPLSMLRSIGVQRVWIDELAVGHAVRGMARIISTNLVICYGCSDYVSVYLPHAAMARSGPASAAEDVIFTLGEFFFSETHSGPRSSVRPH